MTTCTHCALPIRPRPSRLVDGAQLWTQATPTPSLPLVCWKRPGPVKDHQPAPSLAEQVEAALAEVKTAVADAQGDLATDGREVGESDLYHELTGSLAATWPAPVIVEVRHRLGF